MEGNWTELCEMEAIKAAKVFAQSYHNYLVSQETSDGTSQNTPEPSRVGQLFVDHFMEHFELELRRATIVVNGNARLSLVEPVINENNHTNITNGTPPPTGHSSPERSRESSLGRNEEVPVPQNRNVARVRNNQSPDLARKLSVRFWDKTSNIIEKFRRQGRSRTANLPNPNDIVREGHVSVMSGDDRLWDRSRLMLLRKEGGYMLEFYTPPKSLKPKNGIFCFLIHEVRRATALEVPGKDNTFVLKAENNHEYIIEASSEQDMNSWLAHIQSCRRQSFNHSWMSTSSPNEDTPPNVSGRPLPMAPGEDQRSRQQLDLTASDPGGGGQASSEESNEDIAPGLLPAHYSSAGPPEVAPRPDTNPPLIPTDDGIPDSPIMPRSEANTNSSDHPLADYPWFHDSLTRVHAAHLVLQGGGPDRHGVFLVRPSETRKGECVLTFNFHGRPKHLRLTLEADGKCKVTHLWFDSIFDMLAHFRSHPIPLDSKDGCPQPDVTLTEYVPNSLSFSPPDTPDTSQGFNRMPPSRPAAAADNGFMPQSEFVDLGDTFELNMSPPPSEHASLERPVIAGMMARTAANQYSFL